VLLFHNGTPGPPSRLESATTIRLPLLTTASPSGDWPTATRAIRACAGSLSSLAAEKPSSALEPTAVTQRSCPLGENATRLVWQPAGIDFITAAEPGCFSAAATSMTLSTPAPGVVAWSWPLAT
jgi:hypothetical protein